MSIRPAVLSLGILSTLVVAPGAADPPPPTGPQFQVNTHTPDTQTWSSLALDGAGNFVVVWSSYLQDGSYWGVFGQRHDSAGNRLGGEFQVNSYTTASQRYPSVASSVAGDFVVVWESYGQDGSLDGVFAQRYDAAGSRLGKSFQVNSYTTSSQRNPVVAADGLGNFVVAWESDQGVSALDIFARRYDRLGNPLGDEFQVNSYTPSLQLDAALGMARDGAFLVAWTSRDQDGSGDGVFAQRYDAGGVPLGGEFQVNTYTTLSQLRPAVSWSATPGFVVAWRSSAQDGDLGSIHARRYDAAGIPLGDEFQVNTYTTREQREASVASDAAGNFVVSWSSREQDGDGYGVFARRYLASGDPTSGEFQVNTYTTGWQYAPSVASDGSGNFVVVWAGEQDVSYTEVFGQRYRLQIFADGFESGDTSAWSGSVP